MPTVKTRPARSKNPHRGSSFDDFLHDEMAWQRLKKSTFARQLKTSRAALDRLLDPANTSVTLATMSRAAKTLGRRVKLELVPA